MLGTTVIYSGSENYCLCKNHFHLYSIRN